MLALLADGLSNDEIAARLWITHSGVDQHLGHIYLKLHTGRRVVAARWWWEHGGDA